MKEIYFSKEGFDDGTRDEIVTVDAKGDYYMLVLRSKKDSDNQIMKKLYSFVFRFEGNSDKFKFQFIHMDKVCEWNFTSCEAQLKIIFPRYIILSLSFTRKCIQAKGDFYHMFLKLKDNMKFDPPKTMNEQTDKEAGYNVTGLFNELDKDELIYCEKEDVFFFQEEAEKRDSVSAYLSYHFIKFKN